MLALIKTERFVHVEVRSALDLRRRLDANQA